jgi:hypothetical protein
VGCLLLEFAWWFSDGWAGFIGLGEAWLNFILFYMNLLYFLLKVTIGRIRHIDK